MKAYAIRRGTQYVTGQAMPWWADDINEALLFASVEHAERSLDEGDEIVEIEVSVVVDKAPAAPARAASNWARSRSVTPRALTRALKVRTSRASATRR